MCICLGLSSEISSDGFMVDDTAPVVSTGAALDRSGGSLLPDTQVIYTSTYSNLVFAKPDIFAVTWVNISIRYSSSSRKVTYFKYQHAVSAFSGCSS